MYGGGDHARTMEKIIIQSSHHSFWPMICLLTRRSPTATTARTVIEATTWTVHGWMLSGSKPGSPGNWDSPVDAMVPNPNLSREKRSVRQKYETIETIRIAALEKDALAHPLSLRGSSYGEFSPLRPRLHPCIV